jgi:uncharacterized protein (DUF849 family)
MAQPKFIIAVRVNEFKTRDLNPHVPFSPEEIAQVTFECWRQGASVVHFHAREARTGAPSNDTAIYGEIIRLIKERCDIITFPTLGAHKAPSVGDRVAHILALAKDPATKPDCIPVDMLTTNMAVYDSSSKKFEAEESVYTNTIGTLRHICEAVNKVGVKPVSEIWNVASVRCTEAFVDMGLFQQPVYCELPLFEDRIRTHGHPGTIRGMQALLDFFPRSADWQWSAHSHANTFAIAAAAIEAGGHAAIGLGDYHYPELGIPTNGELVTHLASMARWMGREVAGAAEAREMLGMS